MSKRMASFKKMDSHPWFGRLHAKLTNADISKIEAFIDQNDHLPKGDFEMLINRMFLDCSNKPKRWKEISEILSACNS